MPMFDVECCVPSTLESVEKNRTYLYSPYRFNGGAGVDSTGTVPVMYRYLSFIPAWRSPHLRARIAR